MSPSPDGAAGTTGSPAVAAEDPEGPPAPTPGRHRSGMFIGTAFLVVGLLLVVAVLLTTDGRRETPAPSGDRPLSGLPWLSGISGGPELAADFADWRGREVGIAGTWADNNDAMVRLPQLRPGGEYGSWDRSLDIAVGAIGPDESWQEAATGAYDARWRTSLTTLRDLWEGRSGTLYVRFAHEMNGNWFPWKVDAANHQDFIAAWRRFRALQQDIFPTARLVFCVNRESLDTGIDWRDTFPGAEYVDVMGVDYYNQFPYVDTPEAWSAAAWETDAYGAPKGIERHLEFARSVGLPLAVPEWSGNADNGDSPVFVQKMHEFFEVNAGTVAGRLLYEVLFNVDIDGGRWLLFGDETRMPNSADAYRTVW